MNNYTFINIFYKNIFFLITSSNLNKMYCLGFNLGLFFFLQIASGIILTFMYNNNFNLCWFSILSINDFENGFLIRSIHITGTSIIYLLLYFHIIKSFIYLILHNLSTIVWLIGIIIYFFTIIIAFIGYVLPLTQMSYWGLTVFSNIISTVPYIGYILCYWIWGSEFIQDFTLIKVHSLHIFLPFILVLIIILHFYFLHYYISSDFFFDRFVFYYEKSIFTYYYMYRDFLSLLLILFNYIYMINIYWYFVFHEESFEIVNVMKTSDKIIPEWFFLTFFGFIKAVPDKFGGMVLLILSLIIFFTFNIFIINNYYFFFSYNANYKNTIFIIYILYIIGILSVNVTLLFPFLHQLQYVVLIYLIFFGLKLL